MVMMNNSAFTVGIPFYDKTNPNKSEKSPLQLFKSIGAHNSRNVLKEYIMNEKYPKIIQLIGSLK